ncbi:hypothetical protein [Pseudanabaena phage PA-SR01]|nr:hypothetical protein [Pseudanabaena phage PA-SR01]
MNQPNSQFDIKFLLFSIFLGKRSYLIDEDTIRDLLKAVEPKTASQAYRRARLLEILEESADVKN